MDKFVDKFFSQERLKPYIIKFNKNKSGIFYETHETGRKLYIEQVIKDGKIFYKMPWTKGYGIFAGANQTELYE